MKALILAAGKGTRLSPITDNLPKPMAPLGGKPLLEYTVRWLQRFGVDDLVINLHHLPDVITDHFGDGAAFGVRISYSREPELLGTAGALRPIAAQFAAGPFMVIYGDNLTRCDLAAFQRLHRDSGSTCSIALHYREDVTQSGMVVLDEADRITSFKEKPSAAEAVSHWVSAGIVMAEPEVLDYVPDGFSDLARDVFPALLADDRPMYGYRMTEPVWWADSLEDYRRLEASYERGDIVL